MSQAQDQLKNRYQINLLKSISFSKLAKKDKLNLTKDKDWLLQEKRKLNFKGNLLNRVIRVKLLNLIVFPLTFHRVRDLRIVVLQVEVQLQGSKWIYKIVTIDFSSLISNEIQLVKKYKTVLDIIEYKW